MLINKSSTSKSARVKLHKMINSKESELEKILQSSNSEILALNGKIELLEDAKEVHEINKLLMKYALD